MSRSTEGLPAARGGSFSRRHRTWPGLWLAAAVAGCSSEPPTVLEQVKAIGVLRVATMNGPTTYYIGADGFEGFEYELIRSFADELGVDLEIIVPPSFDRLIPLLGTGKAHLAAAGIAVTRGRTGKARFGPTYQIITQRLVYRTGARRPRSEADLVGADIEVIAGSSYAERLHELREQHPDLEFTERNDIGIEDLAERVATGAIDHTIIDSNVLAQLRRIYPDLGVAFEISDSQHLAWAFPPTGDSTLIDAASDFLQRVQADGRLARLIDRYYGPYNVFDYVEAREFLQDVDERLPRVRDEFVAAANAVGLDWRLLAALSYQESRWDPRARSPTGVRGLMMLTRTTARELGVNDRIDPAASVRGGAQYFRNIRDRVPERIPEPDRTWLALAAYNVGFGHLEDARRLAAREGGDPDSWLSVRAHLPLLTRPQWHAHTRYGYARGYEPVHFVRNVRRYYDVLVQLLPIETLEPAPVAEPEITIESRVL
jgi:membrane-bound lytic murein transglycosylase F